MTTVPRIILLLSAVLALSPSLPAQPTTGGLPPLAAEAAGVPAALSVQDICRIQGQGVSVIRGLGIVVGLRGTGDQGSELLLARPLAELYKNGGNPIPDLKELAKGKSAAIVWVTCEIPETGAVADDTFPVEVSVMHSASSLEGGTLVLAPLLSPFAGTADAPYAIAEGKLTIENPRSPTSARIRAGAHMIRDVPMPTLGPGAASFTLIVATPYRDWTTTRTIAGLINSARVASDDEPASAGGDAQGQIAVPLDGTSVRVTVPPAERASPANFIAGILSARFSPSLLKLPAQVIVNERAGSIALTGDVEISPVALSHNNLTITTTTPPPAPTAADPLITQTKWVATGTTGRPSDRVRLQDLLQALKQMDVPIADQISLLHSIERAGKLHARLIHE